MTEQDVAKPELMPKVSEDCLSDLTFDEIVANQDMEEVHRSHIADCRRCKDDSFAPGSH